MTCGNVVFGKIIGITPRIKQQIRIANGEKLDFTAVAAIDSFSDFTAFEWDPGSLGYNSTTLFYTSGGTTSSITLIGVQTVNLSDADFLFA